MNGSARAPSGSRAAGSHARMHAAGLVLLAVVSLPGCRSEEERRAARISELRQAAVRGLTAAERFCAAREEALDSFAAGSAGWERALEEVLLATHDLDDYCIEAEAAHDHELEGSPAPADPRSPPPDTHTHR